MRSLRSSQLCKDLRDECPEQAKALRHIGKSEGQGWSEHDKLGGVEGGEVREDPVSPGPSRTPSVWIPF